MKLPNATHATVAQEKITAYLLVPEHPQNGGEAAFFIRFGFRRDTWEEIAAAFHTHAMTHEVEEARAVPDGMRYTVVGAVPAPDGRAPLVRTVWHIDPGAAAARFITAVPYRRARVR